MRKGEAEPCWRVSKRAHRRCWASGRTRCPGTGLGPCRWLWQRAGDRVASRCWSPLSTLHLEELTGRLPGERERTGPAEAHRCGQRCPELRVCVRLGAQAGHSWALGLHSFMCVCRQAVPRPSGSAELDPGAGCPVQAACSPSATFPQVRSSYAAEDPALIALLLVCLPCRL